MLKEDLLVSLSAAPQIKKSRVLRSGELGGHLSENVSILAKVNRDGRNPHTIECHAIAIAPCTYMLLYRESFILGSPTDSPQCQFPHPSSLFCSLGVCCQFYAKFV